MNLYQNFKDRVRREVSLDSYIQRFVPLRRSGKSMIGLCPFHNEKTPSFHVNPDSGFYHCFGCKASGDLFRFVMDYQKVDFRKSLEILSEYSGIPLIERSPEDEENERKKEALYQVAQKAMEYFQKNWETQSGESALRYLIGRGLTEEDIRFFKIGYGQPGFHYLKQDLFVSENEQRLAETLGLLKRPEGKKDSYDFFRNRILFPVFDTKGRVVAFSGRILGDSEEAKYINSPNSPIYDKSRSMYNLYNAQNSIRSLREVVVVEGVFDAIGLYKKSIENVVAPLGTGFTEGHSRMIKNMADTVYLMMDSDSAGTKGAFRAATLLSKEGVRVRVCKIPEGKDPFDYSRTHNKSEIRELLEKSSPAASFLVQEVLSGTGPKSQPEEKQMGIQRLFQFVKPLDRETDKQLYLEEGARQLGLSFSSIFQDFQGKGNINSRPSTADTRKDRVPVSKGKPSPLVVCERKMIAALVLNAELFQFSEKVSSLEFVDEGSSFLWDYIYTKYLQNESLSVPELLSTEDIPEEYLGDLADHLTNEVVVSPTSFQEMLLHHADLLDGSKMMALVKEMARTDLSIEEKNNLLLEISLLKTEMNKRSTFLRTIQT